jgi:hypothetical protein
LTTLLLVIAAAGCGRLPPTEVVINVSANFCPRGTSDCYLLRIPNADVLAKAEDGLAISGTTDDVGVARTKVPRAGRHTISVSTPVLKDGTREELKETVVVRANETSTIEIKAAIAPDGT